MYMKMTFLRCTTSLISSFALVLVYLSLPVFSAIGTSTPVPPLQWINITGLLSGSAAPPLKGASIGYSDATRTLLIYGGESAGGFQQSNTYLLNLDSLIWTTPSFSGGRTLYPPARSYASSGSDLAASDRHGHVVIGGKGSDGKGLSDVWEFDYISQFWSSVSLSPGGPSPRWGSSGGSDSRVDFIPLTGLNNSFYIAGGYDGTTAYPLSDVWRLNISGALSSNLPDSVTGSWESVHVDSAPKKVDQAGTILYQQVVAVGGCNTTGVSGNACLQGDSYVMNLGNGVVIPPAPCPVPRIEPALAPNMNTASSTFSSQVFLLLGTFNKSVWQDGGGLQKGEVAILDANTGTWSRILPAGDPDSVNLYPTPRSGAVAFSYSQALVGSSRSSLGADTIVFGGEDDNGNYLSELWILRSYNGSVSQSNAQWSGYGNGQLTSGVNANGAGVTVTFMTTCAQAISQPGASGSPPGSSPSSTSGSSTSPTSSSKSSLHVYPYNTSFVHKLLAPLSIAMLLPAILLYRVSSSSVYSRNPSNVSMGFMYISVIAAISAYGLGIGGFATSFTSISFSPSFHMARRSSASYYLRTTHGKAGLALFIAFYGLVPVLALSLVLSQQCRRHPSAIKEESTNSSIDAEREKQVQSPAPSAPTPETSGYVRTYSGTGLWPGSRNRDAGKSSESFRESQGSSSGPSRSFEVTNRPTRTRRVSANDYHPYGEGMKSHRSNVMPRSLSDISWLDRRQNLNAVGELDYALSQLNRGPGSTTPNTGEVLSTNALVVDALERDYYPEFPPPFESLLHILFHALLLALCVLSLVELWDRAPIATFAVFLVWTLAFYFLMFVFAWNGRPNQSIIAVTFSRLQSKPQRHNPGTPNPSRPLSTVEPDSTVHAEGRSPYVHHQPTFRTASGPEDDFVSRQVDTEDENDEDEDAQQRRIEDEMSRRDVSIVTVPRRKLWITNPS